MKWLVIQNGTCAYNLDQVLTIFKEGNSLYMQIPRGEASPRTICIGAAKDEKHANEVLRSLLAALAEDRLNVLFMPEN